MILTRIQQVNERKAFEANAWEASFLTYVQGEDVHGSTKYARAIKIMTAIDSEYTTQLLTDDLATTTVQLDTITVYHGTHEAKLQFTNERTIKNYNHIGTWFTSTAHHANTLYGANVIEAQIVINNPYYATTEDFDIFFYNQTIASKHNATIDNLWKNGSYIAELKQSFINQGYDSIIFENSTIDLSSNEEAHTVVIVLDTDSIVSSQYLV